MAPDLTPSANSPAPGREASPNPAADQDAEAPGETVTARTAEAAQEQDIPAHPAVTDNDRATAAAAGAAGDFFFFPGSHPDTAPPGIPAPYPQAEPRQVELPGAARAITTALPDGPFVPDGPGTGPEMTPAPAPAPRAGGPAPPTGDDIVLGSAAFPPSCSANCSTRPTTASP